MTSFGIGGPAPSPPDGMVNLFRAVTAAATEHGRGVTIDELASHAVAALGLAARPAVPPPGSAVVLPVPRDLGPSAVPVSVSAAGAGDLGAHPPSASLAPYWAPPHPLRPDAGWVRPSIDVHAVRRDFPILSERVHGKRLIWLDNAATTQKPTAVIERLVRFYSHENSNIHRAAHALAARATDAYEGARESVRAFLNAPSPRGVVFVRGATEGINLVAKSWGRQNIREGDEIVLTWIEHHSNLVPWQQLAASTGARLRFAPVDDDGQIILSEYQSLLGPRTRLVAFTQVSNALGTVTPAQALIESAHRHGAKVLVDGAQAVSHFPVDVQALGADFYVLSGHKVFAPTGIGVLWAHEALLDATEPWQGGGNMIDDVTLEHSTYQAAPARFEAGTGSIADAVALGAAVEYLSGLGLEAVHRWEQELLSYGTECLRRIPGLRLIGTAPAKAGILSFVLDGITTEDVGRALDHEGIAVRAGHHCALPALRRFGLESTVRPSLALYNTPEEIDALVAAVKRVGASRRRGR
ncbi:MAG: hypothetical protein AMXMBFR64_40890 [Myxococcales bacterium]